MSNDFLEFVLDQLHALSDIRHRRMFGAFGLYQGEVFFGIVDDGRLYLVTDDVTRPDFEQRGMKAFQPMPDQTLKNYFEVPVDVLEDDTALCEWTSAAVAAQERRRGGRQRKRKRP